MEQIPENKEDATVTAVNKYEFQEMTSNMWAQKWTHEFDQTNLQKESDNSNAEQSDDTHDKSFLEYTILAKVKDGMVYITEGRNKWGCRTIHSRAGKNRQPNIKIGWT